MRKLSIFLGIALVVGLMAGPAFSQDSDGDGVEDISDNCPGTPNGPDLGTCTKCTVGGSCMSDDDCSGVPDSCSMNQEDTDSDGAGDACDNCPNTSNPLQEDSFPPQGNGIGDACDCEADFDCDQDVDAFDVVTFLENFGRLPYYLPCTDLDPCPGDFECDEDVDANDVTILLEDFGRNHFWHNPCPPCEVGDWCVYP